MTTERHADFDALSAYVDGEAPEWVDHVEACAECRATTEELRAVVNAVGERVDPPTPAERDRAIAAALDVAAARPAVAGPDRFSERRRPQRRPWALPAVAAVIIGVLGFSGMILSGYRSSENDATTLAGPGLTSDKADSRAESGVAAAAPPAPVGDLGDVPDVATLRSRAQPGIAPGAAVAPQSQFGGGAAGGAAAPSATAGTGGSSVQTPTTTLNQRAAASGVAGLRPCEEQARTRDPSLGAVVSFATARQGQAQAFVLGFAPAPGRAGPVTLLMLAQDGCSELLRATWP